MGRAVTIHGRDHRAGGADPIPGIGTGGIGSATYAQVRVPVLDTPDFSLNTYPSLSTANGFSNMQRLLPYFDEAGDGSWTGSVRVPPEYDSGAQIILSAVCNATTGVVRWKVGTAAVALNESEDTAVTYEAAQDVTVPGTALIRFDTTFTLSTTIAADDDLNIVVTRNADHANDTCAVAVAIWAVTFRYTIS